MIIQDQTTDAVSGSVDNIVTSTPKEWIDYDATLKGSLMSTASLTNSFLQPLRSVECVDSVTDKLLPTAVKCYRVDCLLAHGDVLEHENASLNVSEAKDIEKAWLSTLMSP